MEQRFFGRQSSSLNSVWVVHNGRRLLLARSDVIEGGLRRLQQETGNGSPTIAPSPGEFNSAPRAPAGPGFQKLDPNVVIIMVVLFLALICAAFVNSLMRWRLRRRAQAANARADRGGVPDDNSEQGLDANTLAALPVLTFKSAEDSRQAEVDCTICLSEFTENERLRLLPTCSHVFHLDCIDMWLLSHTSCPICRDGIKVDELALKVDVHDSEDSGEMMILTLDKDGNPSVTRRSTGSAAVGGGGAGATESGESTVNVRAELKRDKSYDRLSDAERLGSIRRSTSLRNLGSSFREGSMSARLGSSRSSFRSALSAILTSGGDKNSSALWLESSSSTVQATAAGAAAPTMSSTTEQPEGTTGGSLVASEQLRGHSSLTRSSSH